LFKVQGEVCDDGPTPAIQGCMSDCSGAKPCWDCTPSGTTAVDTCIDVCNDLNPLTVPSSEWMCKYDGATFVCAPNCPDGKVVGEEICDDGTSNTNGCKQDCSGSLPGWTCTTGNETTASVCTSKCGDGIRTSEEGCDDGNPVSEDGCPKDCSTFEDGFTCESWFDTPKKDWGTNPDTICKAKSTMSTSEKSASTTASALAGASTVMMAV
jgi:cysteine-rich repeat protein